MAACLADVVSDVLGAARGAAAHVASLVPAGRVDAHVYIGGAAAAADAAHLRRERITSVVDLAPRAGARRHPGVTYLIIDARDDESFDIGPAAAQAAEFICAAAARGERVLVHCRAGVSRSAAVVIYYLMVARGLSLAEAYAKVRRARPIIAPNAGFAFFLRQVDAAL